MSLPPARFVYLASQSPRRRQLLAQIGIDCELLLAGAGEDAEALEQEVVGESPDTYVRRVALLKLGAARERWRGRGLLPAPIVCADTVVVCAERILGKPVDAADARATLAMLSGAAHRVLTAVAVADPAGHEHVAVSVSCVRFGAISSRQIDRYVAGGEPFGKAGAYAIQSEAAAWIAHLEGSYSGVMGLPLYETAQLLRAAGIDV